MYTNHKNIDSLTLSFLLLNFINSKMFGQSAKHQTLRNYIKQYHKWFLYIYITKLTLVSVDYHEVILDCLEEFEILKLKLTKLVRATRIREIGNPQIQSFCDSLFCKY